MRQAAAVVVAGGVGSRLKSKIRKPFIRLKKRPMLEWTLRAFEAARGIGRIVVVAHPDDLNRTRRLVRSRRSSSAK